MLTLASHVGIALTAYALMTILWRVMNARLGVEASGLGRRATTTGFGVSIDRRHEPPRATDLRMLLDELLQDGDSMLRNCDIALVSSIDRPVLSVNGRREELQQLLANVLVLACHAMPGGGLLKVRATARDGQVVMEFLDVGSGGKEPLLAALFRHGSSHPHGRDLMDDGLRASVAGCRRIVDGHCGLIHAAAPASADGPGLTISLPVVGGSGKSGE